MNGLSSVLDCLEYKFNRTNARGKIKMNEVTFHQLRIEIMTYALTYPDGNVLDPRPKFMGVPIWFDNDVPNGEFKIED